MMRKFKQLEKKIIYIQYLLPTLKLVWIFPNVHCV